MALLYPIAGVVLLIGIPVYLHAVSRLQRIVEAAQPGWAAARRSGRIFYTGMPNAADPKINLAVIRFALSTEWRSLAAPQATAYVWRIRVLLPSLSAAFVGVLVALVLGAP